MKKLSVLIAFCFAVLCQYTASSFQSSDISSNPEAVYPCEQDLIEIIFPEDLVVRLFSGAFQGLTEKDASLLASVLKNEIVDSIEPISSLNPEIIDQLRKTGENRTGRLMPDMNNIYRVRLKPAQNIWHLCRTLENLPFIDSARPVPLPMIPPLPPNYQSSQGYLYPASSTPSGIDALYAWTQTGGAGSGVTVCDIEYSWNYSHNDLPSAAGSQIMTACNDPFSNNNHGTAVLGEIVSANDALGTTGICYQSGLITACSYYGSPSPAWNVSGAILAAVSALAPGDVILLEQQWDYTGGSAYVPIEWWTDYSPSGQTNNSVRQAIVIAVANGIHVVEAAGNGNVNLDGMTWMADSGAIIVGAGGVYAGGTYPEGDLQRLSFSSYGLRVHLQGWGENVVTTGYGDLYSADGVNYYYTNTFAGTSSASPIVAGAVAACSGYWQTGLGQSATSLTPLLLRSTLVSTGTAQILPPAGNIGPRPNLMAAFSYLSTIVPTVTPIPTATFTVPATFTPTRTPTPQMTPTRTNTPLATVTPTASSTISGPTITPVPTSIPSTGIQVSNNFNSEWDASAFNNGRRMVRDGDGYFHAVWHSQCWMQPDCDSRIPGNPPVGGRPCGILYSRTLVPASGGSQPPPWIPGMELIWMPPLPVSTTFDDAVDDRYPAIAIENGQLGYPSANDRIHIVWQRERNPGDVYDIYYTTCPNEPAVPPNLLWEQNPGSMPGFRPLYISTDTGSGDILLRNSLVPSICVSSQNIIHVAWQEENFSSPDGINYYSEILYKGSLWPEWNIPFLFTENVSNTFATNSQMPSIASMQDDQNTGWCSGMNVHLAWNDDAVISGTPPYVWYTHSPATGAPGSWMPPFPCSELAMLGGQDGYPSLAIDLMDRAHIAYMHGVIPDDPDTLMNSGRDGYGPGVDPIDLPPVQESYPGPEPGMYGMMLNNIVYFLYDAGLPMFAIADNLPGFDNEFPSIIFDQSFAIPVILWQAYNIAVLPNDYDIYKNSGPGWNIPFCYSHDILMDDVFPSASNVREYAWYGNPVAEDCDGLWNKIDLDLSATGHSPISALSPSHSLWFDGSSVFVPLQAVPAAGVPGIVIALLICGWIVVNTSRGKRK